MSENFYRSIGTYFCGDKEIEKINQRIFNDHVITINIVAKDKATEDAVQFYHIKDIEFNQERLKVDLGETLLNSLNEINSYLKYNGKGKGYKDSNNWGIFYLLKELVTLLQKADFNYYRGQRKSSWSTVPGIFRKLINRDEEYLFEKFEHVYRNIAQEFPDEIKYISLSLENMEERADQLSILQHYGLPTSLLDITENPFIAMLFMLGEGNAIYHPQLEAYKIDIDMNETNSIVSFVNKYNRNKRIRAQKGAFLNYDKLLKFCDFEKNDLVFKEYYHPIQRVILRLNFSVKDSIEYLGGIQNYDKIQSERILEFHRTEDKESENTSKKYSDIAKFQKAEKLSENNIDELVKLLTDGKVNEKQYYVFIQNEMLRKLSEFNYHKSDLFPDFGDYIAYKASDFPLRELKQEKSNKVNKSALKR